MVTFAEPTRLVLLLVPILALGLAVVRHRQRLGQQRRLASPAVWDRLMGGAPSTGLVRMVGVAVAAGFVVLALARPQWGELPEELSLRTRDVVVALDVSDSMLCADVRPNRLGRGLDTIRHALPGLDGNRVGVVVFSGDAYPLVPLTTDLNAVAAFLDAVEPGMVGRGGSNLESAIGAGLELLPADGEGRLVVLVTDGENLQGSPEAAAAALEDAGASLVGVVVGTPEGGPIPLGGSGGSVRYKKDRDGRPVITRADASTLEAMAEATAGAVVDGEALRPERELVAAVDQVRTREVESRRTPRRVDRFPVPLAMAAVSVIVAFAWSPWRRRALVAAAIAMVLAVPAGAQQQPPPAATGEDDSGAASAEAAEEVRIPWWERLFAGGSRRYARRGMSAWQEGDTDGAVEAFAAARKLDEDSPERLFDLGTSLAGRGDLERASELLREAEPAIPAAAYNQGTAALEAGRPDEAVQALRRAVVANPEDADARRNLELALRMLEQQEEEQQQEQEQQDEEKDQEQRPTPEPDEGEPTPTPGPQSGQGAEPTPTPTPNPALYQALDRAEREARREMRSPTPAAATVEKDW